jgi:hypothetical protein
VSKNVSTQFLSSKSGDEWAKQIKEQSPSHRFTRSFFCDLSVNILGQTKPNKKPPTLQTLEYRRFSFYKEEKK